MLAANPTRKLVTTHTQPALDPSRLPSASDADLTLEPATLPEYEQTLRLNQAEWKGLLTDSAYLDRELFLASADLIRDGRTTIWLLTSAKLANDKDKDGSKPILAACETGLKTAYIARDGQLEIVLTHGIYSVYCRPEYRGRGYAQRMMKELRLKLETWQQPPENPRGHFSILYSDIGLDFYARLGWKAHASTHLSLSPVTEAEYREKSQSLPQTHDLSAIDLTSMSFGFTATLKRSLARLSKDTPEKAYIAFQPDMPHFQWHCMREEFMSEFLGHKFPSVKGAVDEATSVAVVWTRVFGTQEKNWHLGILYTNIPVHLDPARIGPSLSAVLLRARYEASLCSLQGGVEVWDPSSEVVQAARNIATNVEVVTRDRENICSLKWNGPATDEVVWLAKQQYTWM